MRTRLVGGALFVLAGAIAACQVIAGIEHVAKVAPEGGVAAEGDAAVSDPCAHVVPPGPPDTDDDKDTSLPAFWLALRTLTLTPRASDQTFVGLDLDGVCTCDGRAGTAYAGRSSCTPKQQSVCDADGGVDNRGASLFSSFATAGTPSVDEGIVQDIAAGRSGLLLWIAGWNGKANDREVDVGALVTTGIRDGSGCGVTDSPDGKHYPPAWCGHDRWDYRPSTTLKFNGAVAPLGSGVGYVTNNTLVVKNATSAILALGSASVAFNSPVTVGTLEPTAGGYKLSGVLAGRMEIGELLGAVGQLQVASGTSKVELCTTPTFEGVKSILCAAVDIPRSTVFDFQDAGCDAISSAMQFVAEPAELGDERGNDPGTVGPCSPTLDTNKSKYLCP